MIPGILIWWVPTAKIRAEGEPPPTNRFQRNILAMDMLGNKTMGINSLIIFVDGMHYYIMKDKLDGTTEKCGSFTELPALMKYYEETYNA